MAQGFINAQNIALPLAVAQGGTGVTTSTGTNKVVLSTAPTFDTSIAFADNTKGILGTATNDSAGTGYVGEITQSTVLFASSIAFTSGVAKNLTSIDLTAGDWQVFGNISAASTGLITYFYVWSSATSATLPDAAQYTLHPATGTTNASTMAFNIPTRRYSVASTTTIYISAQIGMASGTGTFCGEISARRVR